MIPDYLTNPYYLLVKHPDSISQPASVTFHHIMILTSRKPLLPKRLLLFHILCGNKKSTAFVISVTKKVEIRHNYPSAS